MQLLSGLKAGCQDRDRQCCIMEGAGQVKVFISTEKFTAFIFKVERCMGRT